MAPRRPRSLHWAAAVAGALERLKDLAVPIVLGVLVGGGTRGPANALVFGAIGVGLALVLGVAQWSSERYWVDEHGLHHRTGILRRQETTIPRDRVQGIDTVRGPVQRVFGLVELNVQAAGGGRAPEVRLRAVTPQAADELRAALGLGQERPPQAMRRLGTRELLVTALTAGQLGVLLPILAAASQLADDVAGQDAARLVPHDAAGLMALAAAVVALAWLLSTLGAIVAFAGFTVERDGDRLRVRRGLLQRREASIPVSRIEAVRVVESPLRQPFGLAEVRLESAGYAREQRAARTLFPLVARDAVPALLGELLPERLGPLDRLQGAPARARRRYVLPPLAVALALAGVAVVIAGAPGLAAGLLVVPAASLGLARHRAAGWRLEGDRVTMRARRIARVTLLADARRLVRLTRRDTSLTRRARLATFGVAVASGTRMRVAHLDAAAADGLLARLAARATGRHDQESPSPARSPV
jgi:putative membrane protein